MMNAENNKQKAVAAPYVDIYEKEDGYMLVAEMPGVDEKSAKVTVEKGLLTIEGDVTEVTNNGFMPLRLERRADMYRRTFEVSDSIDTAKITAKMKHGVLELRLPRREESKARKIEIAAA